MRKGTTPLLRRPFSVAWTQDDICGFVFEASGGNRLLSELQPGDRLDTLGPLGTFSVVDAGPVVCVSAASGAPPSRCSSTSCAAVC